MPGFFSWCQTRDNNETITCANCHKNSQRSSTSQPQTNRLSAGAISTTTPLLDDNEDCQDQDHHNHHWWEHIYWKQPRTLFEDILTMGNCLAGGAGLTPIIDSPDGTEQDFHNRYLEDRVLGEGEFGVVKMVHDMKEQDESKSTLACKTLRKGVVFKDNTLYAPLKPEILLGEVQILRTLNGEHYCMALKGVYEAPRAIYVVTEFCAGGEMMEYISKQEEDLRTDDVSRIAFQMLDAVNHCAVHNIIHRDIKPENIMFQYPTPGSDLRLIDFGSGTNRVVEGLHTTFAGSAFYISPEMFQRTYSQKTDVWSVGVTLYVLVAGYPADVLQKAFNKLQSSTRNLKDLPNLPDNMPDSFYDLLEGLLVYRHKKRKSAGECLSHEFVQFHRSAFSFEQIAAQAQQQLQDEERQNGNTKIATKRTQSVSLRGSVGRHSLFLDYQKYQRSLTTLLATLLDKKSLKELIAAIDAFLTGSNDSPKTMEGPQLIPSLDKRLDVINMRSLKTLLKKYKHDQV